MKQIYFAFVHSRILYGIEVYANTCNNYLDKLTKLNNKILRILQNRPLSVSVKDLYKKYNTLPIPELLEQQLLILVHEFLFHSEMLPPVFIKISILWLITGYIITVSEPKKNCLFIAHVTTLGKRDTRHKAACLWNKLPSSLKEFSSEC
jgi:hypothetical protein